jgi:hypothetical protein
MARNPHSCLQSFGLFAVPQFMVNNKPQANLIVQYLGANLLIFELLS